SGAPLKLVMAAGLPWNQLLKPPGLLLFCSAHPVGKGLTTSKFSVRASTKPVELVILNGCKVPAQILAVVGVTFTVNGVTVIVPKLLKSTAVQAPWNTALNW